MCLSTTVGAIVCSIQMIIINASAANAKAERERREAAEGEKGEGEKHKHTKVFVQRLYHDDVDDENRRGRRGSLSRSRNMPLERDDDDATYEEKEAIIETKKEVAMIPPVVGADGGVRQLSDTKESTNEAPAVSAGGGCGGGADATITKTKTGWMGVSVSAFVVEPPPEREVSALQGNPLSMQDWGRAGGDRTAGAAAAAVRH